MYRNERCMMVKIEEKRLFEILDSVIKRKFNLLSPFADLRRNIRTEIKKIGLEFDKNHQKIWDFLLKFLNEECNYDYKTIMEIMINERIQNNFIYEIGFINNIYLIGTIDEFERYCKNDCYVIDRFYVIYGIKINIRGIIKEIINSSEEIDIEEIIKRNSKIVYSHAIEKLGDCEDCKDCEDYDYDYDYED